MTSSPMDIAADVLSRADADEVRVMASHNRSGLTRFAESHIHQHVGEDAVTVSLTIVRDGRVADVTTTDTTPDGLSRLVARAGEMVTATPVDLQWPGLAGLTEIEDPGHLDDSTLRATGADRAAIVKAFIDAGGANAAGYCDTTVTTIALVDSAGASLRQTATSTTLDGIHRLADGTAGSAHQTSAALSDLDGELAGVQARRLADLGTVTADFTPGRVPVVLGPEAVATIAIFLGFYGHNAKSHAEGQSGIRLGEAQFDPAITLVDDGLDPRSLGLGFDLEGTARRRVALIEEGVSTSLVHDRRSAAQAGTHRPGTAVPGRPSTDPLQPT